MSIKYTVTHYYFSPPKPLSVQEYIVHRNKLQTDPNYTLVNQQDAITRKFGHIFKFLIGTAISLPICIILMIFEDETKDNGFLSFILIITILWSIAGIFLFLLSATDLRTYAGYLKTKRKYFSEMESEIRKSKSYEDFYRNFYK
jgi:hypothetical protein